MFAVLERVCTLLNSSPVTRPYTASSQAMPGSIAAGGIAVSRLESTGPSTPQTSPYGQEHMKPQSSTGMCIGRKIEPAFGMA